jgi:hypothetical protein
MAGRRVDAADAENVRFPLQNVDLVRTRVRAVLEDEMATMVISAAACGADLIALSEAGEMGLRRRVILPFDRARFRETSVADRPGDWGAVYDQILDEVAEKDDLVILHGKSDAEAYEETNQAILDETVLLAKETDEQTAAVVIWDGASRGPGDVTQTFVDEAKRRGMEVVEVKTT